VFMRVWGAFVYQLVDRLWPLVQIALAPTGRELALREEILGRQNGRGEEPCKPRHDEKKQYVVASTDRKVVGIGRGRTQ
jgi:hypothetical protein